MKNGSKLEGVLDNRATVEGNHMMEKLVLVVAIVLLLCGFVPQARIFIGFCLTHGGLLLQSFGQDILAEQAGVTVHSGHNGFKWLAGLLLLLSPFLIWSISGIFAKAAGINQARAENRAQRV